MYLRWEAGNVYRIEVEEISRKTEEKVSLR
jgi:hypothetical protein